VAKSAIRANVTEIRKARRKKGWTQEQLASAAGYALGTIQKFEQGTYYSNQLLKNCTTALGIDASALMVWSARERTDGCDVDPSKEPRGSATVPPGGHVGPDERLETVAAALHDSLPSAPEKALRQHSPQATVDRSRLGIKPPSHLVGRAAAQSELRAALQSADAGHGRVIFVRGEPGMGKTALVEDLLSEFASDPDYLLAIGRCYESFAGAPEPYLAFREALRTLLADRAGEKLSGILRSLAAHWYLHVTKIPMQKPLPSGFPDPQPGSPSAMKLDFVDFVQEITRARTLVLFLDDLHWADAATIDLVSYVADHCDERRVVMILTYRPSDSHVANEAVLQLKDALHIRGRCLEISLDVLSTREVESYLELEFPGHCFPPEFIVLVSNQTDGLPLFLVDLLEDLRGGNSPAIELRDGHWALIKTIDEVKRRIPDSVRSMVRRKVARLADSDCLALSAASVQGHEFNAWIVAQALDHPTADVEERLQELADVHALVRFKREEQLPDGTPTARYSFVHSFYKEAFFERLAISRRSSISKAVANGLLTHYGDEPDKCASQVAGLLETAGDFEGAADYFLRACRYAVFDLYATPAAVAPLASDAIGAASKLHGPKQFSRVYDAATLRAQLHQSQSKYEQAAADFLLAEQAAQQLGKVDCQVEAICGRAMSLFELKDVDGAQADANRARKLASANGLNVGVASAEIALACVCLCTENLTAAEGYFDRAIPVLLDNGLPDNSLEGISFRALLHAWRLEYEDAERTFSLVIDKARHLPGGVRQIENWFLLGMARGNRGQIGEALDLLHKAQALAEKTDDVHHICRLPNTIGWIHRELQDFEKARGLDLASFKASQVQNNQEAEANALVNLALDHLELEERSQAFDRLTSAQRVFEMDTWFRWRYNIRLQAAFASYWIAAGDVTKALTHAQTSLGLADKALARKHIAWAHKLLGDIAVLQDRTEDAHQAFAASLGALKGFRCPTVEWKVLTAAAALEKGRRTRTAYNRLWSRRQAVVKEIAESIQNEALTKVFLSSRAVTEG
jgi:tetratricopeptide (TPR) repeat protein/transcriptional regulator with XRE-family HTH domain